MPGDGANRRVEPLGVRRFGPGDDDDLAAYVASLAATGILVPNSANDAAVKPITIAAAINANGACMPLRPAAAPTST